MQKFNLKTALRLAFFPTPYPQLFVLHGIYGGLIMAIITQEASYRVGTIGPVLGILVGLVAFVSLRKKGWL